MSFPSDLAIARAASTKPLPDIASTMGIGQHLLEPYGDELAKIRLEAIDELADRPKAKYVVVTAITPDPARRGQDHHDGRARPGDEAHRQERGDLAPPALDGPDVRHQGRGGRRRLQPGDPDGAAQPAPHRRLPRGDRGPQPARRRWSTTTSTRATSSTSTSTTSPGGACSTSTTGRCATSSSVSAASEDGVTRQTRLRHHRRLRGDGHLRARHLAGGHARPARVGSSSATTAPASPSPPSS